MLLLLLSVSGENISSPHGLTISIFYQRFAAGMWFFFALIMIASYTANLAAFLTVETLERPIESVEDLAAQSEIWYGAMKDGSTAGFFEKSNNDIYQRLWSFMSGEPLLRFDLGITLNGQVCTRQR